MNKLKTTSKDALIERERALLALEKMKQLEKEMSPRMTTIVMPNGTIISSTSDTWLMECKKRHERTIRIVSSK